MNKIYKTKYNEALGAWVAVPEIAKSAGKKVSNGAGDSIISSHSIGLFRLAVLVTSIISALGFTIPSYAADFPEHYFSIKPQLDYSNKDNNGAEAVNSMAIGLNAVTKGDSSVAIGAANIEKNGKNSIVIGANPAGYTPPGSSEKRLFGAESDADGGLAVGNRAVVKKDSNGAQAIGRGATVFEASSGAIALGQSTISSGIGALAIGGSTAKTGLRPDNKKYHDWFPREDDAAYALAEYSLALSTGSSVYSDHGIAIGKGSQVGEGSIQYDTNNGKIYGTDASSTNPGKGSGNPKKIIIADKKLAENGIAIGANSKVYANNSVALGSGSQVLKGFEHAVAFGSHSVANRGALNNVGKDNVKAENGAVYGIASASDSDKEAIANTVKGDLGAFSVGDVSNQDKAQWKTRQIIGVAAGSEDTDAVNVAQLKAVANGSLTFAGDTGTQVQRKLGSTININGADGNIKTQAEGNSIKIKLSRNLDVDSVQAGDTTVNDQGVTINGGPSITKSGINAGGKVITGIADGKIAPRSSDAINGDQLYNMANDLIGYANEIDQRASAGIAGSMASAGLPQAYLPGKSMVAAAAGSYRGKNAIAIGVSSISDNGKWILKGTANANSEDFGVTVGVGYQW